ncbi:MAG: hypothetical protein KDE27_03445 [Planctomycetes bacterium]|nr:hypothetical protein [Planctomycetota bacterium]
MRDDAFYEFSWAANVAAGRGPVVSDGVTTSGVQLLWSVLLVPVAFCCGAAALPLVAPWLGLLLHLGAAGVIAVAGRRSSGALAAAAAALCWLGNPLLVREAQNGQETALAAFCAVLLWFARRGRERWFFVSGALATFARTDLFALFALLALARLRRHGWRTLLAPTATLAALFAINRALGGSVLPDSGAPMAWLWHANFAATDPTAGETLARWWWFGRPALLGGPWQLAGAAGAGLCIGVLLRAVVGHRAVPWRGLPLAAVVIALALGAADLVVPLFAGFFALVLPANGSRPLPRDLLALVLGAGAIVALHWAVRWYPRDYYAAPLALLTIAALLRLGRVRWLVTVVAISQLVDLVRIRPEPLGGQRAMALAAHGLGELLPAGERVASFNSGLLTFEADVLPRGDVGDGTPRGVVNLDGVVDARAFAALQRHAVLDWLDDLDVRFLVDDPRQFASDPRQPHANGRWLAPDFDAATALRVLARFEVPDHPPAVLYWRVGRGVAPPIPSRSRDLGPFAGGRAVLWAAAVGQTLESESAAGERAALAVAAVDGAIVVFVPPARLGSGRLFVRGETTPVLTLPRL